MTPRRLTLVRHAQAEPGTAALDDFDRPLSAQGRCVAAAGAARLAALVAPPDLVIASPASRTLETARIFAAALRYPPERIQVPAAAYLASAAQLLDLLRKRGGNAVHLMLFGHNPGLSDLAARLTGQPGRAAMAPCAVLGMDIAGPGWAGLGPCTGSAHAAPDWPS